MFTHDNWFDNVDDRPTPWPGVSWVSTMLIVPNIKQAIEFYQKAFGFVPIYTPGFSSGNLTFARMRYRGLNINLNREGAFDLEGKAPMTTGQVPPFYFYMFVDSVKDSHALALSQGCSEMQAPAVAYWGDKVSRVKDIYGYIWELATRCTPDT